MTSPFRSALNRAQERVQQIPQQAVENLVGSSLKVGENAINSVVGRAKDALVDKFVNDTGFGKALRAVNLLAGATPQGISFTDGNWSGGNDNDWRVRLSLPANFSGSPLMRPLLETNGLIFPYLPSIILQSSANYKQLSPTHNNYPFFAYENSSVEQFAITGQFTVENSLEGEYWVAAVHYLRSVTKMAYGRTSNQGSPPPIVLLNGYGEYVFKNVPCVVTNFTVELAPDVDYIKTGLGVNGTWAPAESQISVSLQPQYSRRAVERFSLDAFVRGDYVFTGRGYM